MWRAYFVACDDAKGDKKQGGGEMEFSEESDPTKLGIPQDDAAKEEAKKRMEEQGMRDLLSQYGSEALRDTYWSFCKADNPDTTMLRFLRARKVSAVYLAPDRFAFCSMNFNSGMSAAPWLCLPLASSGDSTVASKT